LTSAARSVYHRTQDRLAPVCPPLAGRSTPGGGAGGDRFSRNPTVAWSVCNAQPHKLTTVRRLTISARAVVIVPGRYTVSVSAYTVDPEALVPPPGVEWPASGGHTRASRS